MAKYAQLQAVLEMGRRHLAERLRRDSILESPQAVRDYLKARLRYEQHEVFACLFLGHEAPGPGVRGAVPGQHRWRQRLPAPGGQAHPGAQRGGADPDP
ncbi:hypothetical protein ACPA9J_21750 [Pseudomonas aeruginosa]